MPKITIDLEFVIGDFVMLKTDRKEKFVRLVKGFRVTQLMAVEYELNFGSASSWHYAFEIDKAKEPALQVTPVGFTVKPT